MKPTSTETVKRLLEQGQTFNRAWLERYFMPIAERGHVEYSDVDNLTMDQSDAVRVELMQQIEFFSKKMNTGAQILNRVVEKNEVNGFAVKVGRFRETLEDLCEVYGLKMPVIR